MTGLDIDRALDTVSRFIPVLLSVCAIVVIGLLVIVVYIRWLLAGDSDGDGSVTAAEFDSWVDSNMPFGKSLVKFAGSLVAKVMPYES